MKKKIISALLAAVMVFSLTACGGGSDKKSADGTCYNTYLDTDPTTMDPVKGNDTYSMGILRNIMEPLTRLEEDGDKQERKGAGAESWESNDDGTVWTFHLRDNKWSDGEPVTADDYVYGMKQTLDPEAGSPNAFYITCIKNGEAIYNGEKDVSELGVKAVDDKTLEVTTTTRVSFFDELMSFPCFYPINQKFCEKQGDKYGKSADSILGNGAFVMTNWEPGSVAEFEKNDKYYDAKTVKIDKLVMKLVQDPKVAAQAFEAGETDFAIINSDLVDKYKKDDSFKQINEGYLFYISVNFQNSDLANLNVRKALSLAINRKDLCENVLKDGSQAASGFVPSGLSISPEGKDFRDEADTYTSYDKKAAQAALDEGLKELGKSEITLRLTYGTDESPMDVFATYLQNALSKLDGIKVEMVATTKQDRIYNKQKNGDFDLAVTRWGPDYGDPTTYLTIALSTNGSNYGKYTNSELDALMDKVANESDANTRWQKMKDAEKILLDGYAYIPVFEKGAATLQNPKVKNLVIKPCRTISFEYVEKTE